MTINITLNYEDDFPDLPEYQKTPIWTDVSIHLDNLLIDTYDIETTRSDTLQDIFTKILAGAVDETLNDIKDAIDSETDFKINNETLSLDIIKKTYQTFIDLNNFVPKKPTLEM